VSVHLENCPNIAHLEPERKVEVTWDTASDNSYPVSLQVITADQKGMLAAVSNAISRQDANILEAKVRTCVDMSAVFSFVIEVENGEHLRKVLSEIRRVSGVIRVERTTGKGR
jgi:GTP pyrophosphokinase